MNDIQKRSVTKNTEVKEVNNMGIMDASNRANKLNDRTSFDSVSSGSKVTAPPVSKGSEHGNDYVFVAKAYGGLNKEVKEEIYTSKLESLKEFITSSSDHIGLDFYSNGDLIKSLNYQSELDQEDIMLLIKSWISKLESCCTEKDQ